MTKHTEIAAPAISTASSSSADGVAESSAPSFNHHGAMGALGFAVKVPVLRQQLFTVLLGTFCAASVSAELGESHLDFAQRNSSL